MKVLNNIHKFLCFACTPLLFIYFVYVARLTNYSPDEASVLLGGCSMALIYSIIGDIDALIYRLRNSKKKQGN